MKKLLLIAASGLAFVSASADATTMKWTMTGILQAGTDNAGLFGTVGADLQNASYSVELIYDLTRGADDIRVDSVGRFGGLNFGQPQSVTTSGTLTVNGQSYSLGLVDADAYAAYNGQFTVYVEQNAGGYKRIAFSTYENALQRNLTATVTNLPVAEYGSFDWQIGSGPVTSGYFGASTLTIQNLGGSGPIPEPASWAMLIAGFGLAGAAMRRRRASALAV